MQFGKYFKHRTENPSIATQKKKKSNISKTNATPHQLYLDLSLALPKTHTERSRILLQISSSEHAIFLFVLLVLYKYTKIIYV